VKVNDTALAPLSECLSELVLDHVIVTPRGLDAMFAGLAQTGSSNVSSGGHLQMLSVRDVFVNDDRDSAVGQHFFRHLANTR